MWWEAGSVIDDDKWIDSMDVTDLLTGTKTELCNNIVCVYINI